MQAMPRPAPRVAPATRAILPFSRSLNLIYHLLALPGIGLKSAHAMSRTNGADATSALPDGLAAAPMPSCYCYILECRDGSFYTGWTTDTQRRLKAHNAGRGARYTSAR